MNNTIKKTTTAIALSLTMVLGVSTNAMADVEQPKSGWETVTDCFPNVEIDISTYCLLFGCDSKS
jgi:hypothetical protein